MIADLHAHYPMHLAAPGERDVLELLTSGRGLGDIARGLIIELASRIANYRSFDSGPGVTIETLRAGGVGVVLSVLYSPFSELDDAPGTPPKGEYLDTLLAQLERVEDDLARPEHAAGARVVRNASELDAALREHVTAFVHCVEGGFHVGGTTAEIDRGVQLLARRGVAYITVAHLLYRGIATNSNALPFLADPMYHLLFPQPETGLSKLGRALITAMVREGVLIDVAHMSERSLHDTFELLEHLDPARRVPVIATHTACRFGKLEYNLADGWIARIAQRGGVCGAIVSDHYARDGLRKLTKKNFAGSVEAIVKQIDRVDAAAGSSAVAAIGSDLDGFIRPNLAGLDDSGRLAALEAALIAKLGSERAEAVCSGNALRVLRGAWGVGAP